MIIRKAGKQCEREQRKEGGGPHSYRQEQDKRNQSADEGRYQFFSAHAVIDDFGFAILFFPGIGQVVDELGRAELRPTIAAKDEDA